MSNNFLSKSNPSPAPEVMGTRPRIVELKSKWATLKSHVWESKFDTGSDIETEYETAVMELGKFIERFPQPDPWVDVKVGLLGPVYVNNPQFVGYGIAQYDSGARKRVIGVLLENGNTWEYDADTVRLATPNEIANHLPRVLREQLPAPPETRATEGKVRHDV